MFLHVGGRLKGLSTSGSTKNSILNRVSSVITSMWCHLWWKRRTTRFNDELAVGLKV